MSTRLADLPAGKALLSSSETAAALGTGTRTVRVWLERGRFPGAIKHPGGHWRIPAAAVTQVRAELGISNAGEAP